MKCNLNQLLLQQLADWIDRHHKREDAPYAYLLVRGCRTSHEREWIKGAFALANWCNLICRAHLPGWRMLEISYKRICLPFTSHGEGRDGEPLELLNLGQSIRRIGPEMALLLSAIRSLAFPFLLLSHLPWLLHCLHLLMVTSHPSCLSFMIIIPIFGL